jgi:CheY-like chemotaxis protein
MLPVHSHPDSMPTGSPLGDEVGDRELRVLVVDDHPAATGVMQLVAEQPDLVVVDAVGSAEAAMSLAGRDQIDVAVVDISWDRTAVCG